MDKPSIEVMEAVVKGDPDITIWRVIIKTDKGIWTEGFGNKDSLNAFLKGLQAAFSFTEVGYVDVFQRLKVLGKV